MNWRRQWWGSVPYAEALERQAVQHRAVVTGEAPGAIFGLEHPPVITLGVRGRETLDLSAEVATVQGAGWPVFRIDRGGQATLHSPGQLVIYPILPVTLWGGTREFVRMLLETTADLLRAHGVEAWANECKAGVFTPSGKIGFCGLRIQQGVSRHGLALNVQNDLSAFRWIRPCGQAGEPLTSWEQSGVVPPPLPQIFEEWCGRFEAQGKVSSRRISPCSPEAFPAL